MKENGISLPLPLARRELAALAGITPMRFDELFECTNVLSEWPGRSDNGKNDVFPMDRAIPAAKALLPKLEGRKVVLLGQRVSAAFDVREPIFQWVSRGFAWRGHDDIVTVTCHLAVSPHPSTANRWWNKPENRISARMFWGTLASDLSEQKVLEGT